MARHLRAVEALARPPLTDVSERLHLLAKEECDKALSGLPGHAANVPKSLVVHYQYRGRDSFAAFGPGSAVTIGDLVEKK